MLEELFEQMRVGVVSNVNFYQTDNPNEQPKSPDIAVVDGFRIELEQAEHAEPTSYYVGRHGPPPRLVFEILSEETWRLDLENKPSQYATMEVREYIAFDPNLQSLWKKQWKAKGRLMGWRLEADGQYHELEKDGQGRIWSEEMQSWLVVEGKLVGVYSAQGERRLTKEQADEQRTSLANQRTALEQQQRKAAEQLALTERQQHETAEQQTKAAEQAALLERQQREAAQQQAERERRRAEKLAELIRLNGIKLEEEL